MMAIIVIAIIIIGLIIMWKIAKISDKQQGIKRDNETFKKEMKPVFNVSFILLSITGLLIFLSSPFIIYFLVELYS